MVKNLQRLIWYVLVLVIFGGAFYAVSRSQDIIDWWKLRGYVPSPRIVQITEEAQFTDYAERLFYVNDPTILRDKKEFADSCRTSAEIIVLGCHITNQKIYIYDVEDDRLQGIVQVTAAHEMLHAAFDRLSISERERVIELLEKEYEELQIGNKRLSDTIDSYRQRDPSVVPNELHSILGTEVRTLSSQLEEYYSKYFANRGVVVTLAEKYEEEFIKREEKIAAYDKTLADLNGSIVRLEADIVQQSQALQSERSLLESQRNNPQAFNAGVPIYNANVSEYNAIVNQLKLKVEEYNKVVSKRNEIALEERDLVEAIDSRVEKL
jgi:hypothetical protein